MDPSTSRPIISARPSILSHGSTPVVPIVSTPNRVEDLVAVLRDDVHRIVPKLEALKAFLDNAEELTVTQSFAQHQREIYTSLITHMRETRPSYIAENDTQKLRKIILQLLLRLQVNDTFKQVIREQGLPLLLFSLIHNDNEENALLAIKIINEHIKVARLHSREDLANFFSQVKLSYNQFLVATRENKSMFLAGNAQEVQASFDEEVNKTLKSLYYTKALNLRNSENETPFQYNLVPRGSMSVKVFSELPPFFIALYSVYRQYLFDEINDLIYILDEYLSICVPSNVSDIGVDFGDQPPALNAPLIDEFHNSQVRAMYFLAWIMKQQHLKQPNVIESLAPRLTNSMIQLLESLNPSVTTSRREFIMSIKIFLTSDIRNKFIGIIPTLTNERHILGESFSSQDFLRNVVYSLLADMLHHVRMNLNYSVLIHLFNLCVRCLHDTQLVPHNQTMYGKLLMNLCDPLLAQEKEKNLPARETFLYGLEAFVRKTKVLADYILPGTIAAELAKRETAQQQKEATESQATAESQGTKKVNQAAMQTVASVHWQEQSQTMAPHDCRNMIRFIINPVKILAVALSNCHLTHEKCSFAEERDLYNEFFVHGLRCLNQFMSLVNQLAQNSQYTAQLKIFKKDEKECVDMFASIFYDAHPQVFEYIISRNVDFLIESIVSNKQLQEISSLFLSNRSSTTMGTILIKYLITRMPDIGVNGDRAKIYLTLFNQVFRTVSTDQSSTQEAMLMPFLHEIVAEAMQVAMRAREPWNYFQLLRFLFRSIGTGAHDQLYREFLPLLPSILQQLNRFQNGSHRQPIHDLYVELCLTVPVRLSSLLPHLALLMDPLVCALHGSQSLVQQGLRTLELCVDNLQPDYFFDHMDSVRASLMQGLWRALYTQDLSSATSALRILGKLGGSSRRAFLDAQVYEFIDDSDKSLSMNALKASGCTLDNKKPVMLSVTSDVEVTERPSEPLTFPMGKPIKRRHDEMDAPKEIKPITVSIPISSVVDSAVAIIRSSQVSEHPPPLTLNWAHWQSGWNAGSNQRAPRPHALEVCRTVLYSVIQKNPVHKLEKDQKKKLLMRAFTMWKEKGRPALTRVSADHRSRTVFASALSGVFYGIVASELRETALPFFSAMVTHLTTQVLLDSLSSQHHPNELDGLVLIDVICHVLSDSCREFAYAGLIALSYTKLTVSYLFGEDNLSEVCQLQLFDQLVTKVLNLCYKRDWYARLGGCTAMRFIIENFPREFVIKRTETLLDAFFTVISGVADEVSSGAVDVASKCLDLLLTTTFSTENVDENLLHRALSHAINYLSDPEALLRTEATRILEKFSTLTGKSVGQLLRPMRDQLRGIMFNGFKEFPTMTAFAQIGFLEFFYTYVNEVSLLDQNVYTDAKSFAKNLELIVWNTDVSLNSMPSCRYASSNLGRGCHSLEIQMGTIRTAAFKAIGSYVDALIAMKSELDVRDRDQKRVSQLAAAVQAIDIEKLNGSIDGSNALAVLIDHAYELAGLRRSDKQEEYMEMEAEDHIKILKSKCQELRDDLSLVDDLGEHPKIEDLNQKLRKLVRFLLNLAIHEAHPKQPEAKELLSKICKQQPEFCVPIHSCLSNHLSLIQPVIALNPTLANNRSALEKLKFMDVADRFALRRHQLETAETGHGLLDQNQSRVLFTVDVEGEQAVEHLLNGPMPFKIKNANGQVVATGKVVGFSPLKQADSDVQLSRVGTGVPDLFEESLATAKVPFESLKRLKKVDFELPDASPYPEQDKLQEITSEMSEQQEQVESSVSFVVADRKDDQFVFRQYAGPFPPKFCGSFITFTRTSSGHFFRSIRNYDQTTVDQHLEHQTQNEIERQLGNSASLIFDEIDETTAAHLTEVAKMLMLEAQSLGLDQPPYITLKQVNSESAKVDDDIGENNLQDIFDFDDKALEDIDAALLDMPESAFFDDKPDQQSEHGPSSTTTSPAKKTAAPSSTEPVVQQDIDQKDGLDAGYAQQHHQPAEENVEAAKSDGNGESSSKAGASKEGDDVEMDEKAKAEEATVSVSADGVEDVEKREKKPADEFVVVRTDKDWVRPVVCHVPVDRDHRAVFEKAHVAVDNIIRLDGESLCRDDDLAGVLDDHPIAQHPHSDMEVVFADENSDNLPKSIERCTKMERPLEERKLDDKQFEELLDHMDKSEWNNAIKTTSSTTFLVEGAEELDLTGLKISDKLGAKLQNGKNVGKLGIEIDGKPLHVSETPDLQVNIAETLSGPYDYVTEPKLRVFLNQLHAGNPQQASRALEHYVKKMTDVINKEYSTAVPVDADGVVRVRFAQESVVLPTGQVIETLPRTQFNYLAMETINELQDFDDVNERVRASVREQALSKDMYNVEFEVPSADDQLVSLTNDSIPLTPHRLKVLRDLRDILNVKLPDQLVTYLVGEVGHQLFHREITTVKLDELDLLEQALGLVAELDVMSFFTFLANSISFLAEVRDSLFVTDEQKLFGAMDSLLKCLAKEPNKAARVFVGYPMLTHRPCSNLVRMLVERPLAAPIRREILKLGKRAESLLFADQLEDEGGILPKFTEELTPRTRLGLNARLFRVLYSTVLHSPSEDLAQSTELANVLLAYWRSDEMLNRYSLKDGYVPCLGIPAMSAHRSQDPRCTVSACGEMTDTPELIVRILVEFCKVDVNRLDILYDASLAFSHRFLTDFTFLKKYIDDEIVPKVPMEWRHQAFKRMVQFFHPRRESFLPLECEILSRYIQYVVTPCFVYAFNNFPVDEVVGAESNPEVENENSIVWQFCMKVIDPYKSNMAGTDALKITLYQLCALLVQNCQSHIHDTKKQKKQGECLRLFMLFGWPCLQANHRGDLIEKYAGHFLVANLMEEFAIVRKLVMQTLDSLIAAHQPELREVVRKALDVLIPAITQRNEDGDQHLVTVLKKYIDEQLTSQTVHCVSVASRHYKVLFRLRCQMAKILNSAVTRLFSQAGNEAKKAALDMCETVIKWEQHRQKMLESIRATESAGLPVPRVYSQAKPFLDVTVDNLREPFDQSVIDSVFGFLLRLATTVETPQIPQGVDTGVRRALMLLRLAVKHHIFGDSRLRLTLLEKPFIQYSQLQPEVQQQQNNINVLTQTIDVVSTIITGQTVDTIKAIMENLEHLLADCLSYPHVQITQNVLKLVAKLIENSRTSPNGLEDFKKLNEAISRYLATSLNLVHSASVLPSVQILHTATMCLQILRIFCKTQPLYLETVCFGSFVKVLQRLARDYLPTPQPDRLDRIQPQDRLQELLLFCFDLVRPRLAHMNAEPRRTIAQSLLPLTDKPLPERLLDRLVVVGSELVQHDIDVTPNYGLQLLAKVAPLLQKSSTTTSTVVIRFLNAVHHIFSSKELRKSDAVQKIQTAFFWGLASQDEHTRRAFFGLFESQFPPALFDRFHYIIGEQNWLPMANTFWINHCLNLLMKSAVPSPSQRSELMLVNSSLTSQYGSDLVDLTLLSSDSLEQQTMDTDSEVKQEESMYESPVKQEQLSQSSSQLMWRDSPVSPDTKVTPDQLMDFEKSLSADPPTHVSELFRSLIEMCYVDSRLCKQVFADFFSSVWGQMPPFTSTTRRQVAEYFLLSGVTNNAQDVPLTPLNCLFETFLKCTPSVDISPSTLEYLAINHKCWYTVIEMLEKRVRSLPLARHIMNTTRLYHEDIQAMDVLCALYEKLDEGDMSMMAWSRRACLNGTAEAMHFFSQGMYKEARIQCRLALKKGREVLSNEPLTDPNLPQTVTSSTAPFYDVRAVDFEMRVLEKIWLESCRELSAWKTVSQYTNQAEVANFDDLAEAAWHLSEWPLLKEVTKQLEATGLRANMAQAMIYRSMCNISLMETGLNRKVLDYSPVELSSIMINEWRRLPPMVSGPHIDILRRAQRVQEITESAQFAQAAIEKANRAESQAVPVHNRYNVDNAVLNEIKQTIKTWRCRPITVPVDSLSHWSSTFCWRVQQYFNIMRIFESADIKLLPQQCHMQPVHSVAQTQINHSRMLRKVELFDEAMQELAHLYAMPQVYRIDSTMFIVEECKCLLRLCQAIEKVQKHQEVSDDSRSNCNFPYGIQSLLKELNGRSPKIYVEKALGELGMANLKLFPKEMVSRLLSLRGQLLSYLDQDDEAQQAFSAAAQMAENAPPLPLLINNQTVWKYWAQHLEKKFNVVLVKICENGLNEELYVTARKAGMECIVCLMEHLRLTGDSKSKHHMASFFHVYRAITSIDLMFGRDRLAHLKSSAMEPDEVGLQDLDEVVGKHTQHVPVSTWLFWLDQIVTEVSKRCSKSLTCVLRKVADAFPQQTLLAVRSVLHPTVITERLNQLQHRMPLIVDWIRLSAPLELNDNGLFKKLPSPTTPGHEGEIGHGQLVAQPDTPTEEHVFLIRKRDQDLRKARKVLTLVQKKLAETDLKLVQKCRLLDVERTLKERVTLLTYMKKNRLLPNAPKKMIESRELKSDSGIDEDSDVVDVSGSDSDESCSTFIRIKMPRPSKPTNILIDTTDVQNSEYDLDLSLAGAEQQALEVVAEAVRSETLPDTATDLLLSVVDSLAVDRFADIKALNDFLNELDQFPLVWADLLYGDLRRLLESLTNSLASMKDEVEPSILTSHTCDLKSVLSKFTASQLEIANGTLASLTEFEESLKSELVQYVSKFEAQGWEIGVSGLKSWLVEQLAALAEFLNSLEGVVPLRELSPYLARFSGKVAQIDVPGCWIPTRHCVSQSQISYFLPTVKRSFKHNGIVYIFSVLSQNGKTLSYMLQKRTNFTSDSTKVMQALTLLNMELEKKREICRRQINFPVPKLFWTGPTYMCMEVSPLSSASVPQVQPSPEHAASRLKTLSELAVACLHRHDPSVTFWTQLGVTDSAPPANLLTDWVRDRCPEPATFWTIRKKLTQQWATLQATVLALGLKPVGMDKVVVDLASAQMFVTDNLLQLVKGESGFGPVPPTSGLRLTPNLAEFFRADRRSDSTFMCGHLSGTFTVVIRSLAQTRALPTVLRVLLWDACEQAAADQWSLAETQTDALRFVCHHPTDVVNTLNGMSVMKNGKLKALDKLEAAVGSTQSTLPSEVPWF